METLSFQGKRKLQVLKKTVEFYEPCAEKIMGLTADKFVKGPVASKNATGPDGFIKGKNSTIGVFINYRKNLEHTYEHKKVFAIVEKELFGKNSIDSITHDLDKLIMYAMGFPKSIVSSGKITE